MDWEGMVREALLGVEGCCITRTHASSEATSAANSGPLEWTHGITHASRLESK
ncbi:hypothetical protein HNQ08_003754 [Deinococcus humi]|uniref:Uncharacterized protein n=1 Tax=Deinococcus humi TaxID=662880 RepID=A0A7W8JWQ2_9DEIO|nr:hypothetical protein [Deinococcus humi]